jgi:hypothetical protein
LTKKEERQVGDLLHQNFPEVTPPPSDHSSVSCQCRNGFIEVGSSFC